MQRALFSPTTATTAKQHLLLCICLSFYFKPGQTPPTLLLFFVVVEELKNQCDIPVPLCPQLTSISSQTPLAYVLTHRAAALQIVRPRNIDQCIYFARITKDT